MLKTIIVDDKGASRILNEDEIRKVSSKEIRVNQLKQIKNNS